MSSKISLKSILHPKTSAGTWARDIVSILLCVALIGTILFSITGIWPPLVAVESGSMEPNIPTYSLVFVSDEERFGGWQTQEEALNSSSDMKFNEYGDVIVYRPNGITGVTPIIHRAITHVTAEEAETLLNFTGEAAHAGYITKGDNEKTNPAPDQEGIFKNYGRMQPVKPEWIVGKAVFAIPFVGWIPLNIIPSILIVVGIIIVVELITHIIERRKNKKSEPDNTKPNQSSEQLMKK